MSRRQQQLATDLYELAEDFNREDTGDEAYELKMIFKRYFDKLSKSDQREVTGYLESIGG